MDPTQVLATIRKVSPGITVVGESLTDVWYLGTFGEPAQEDAKIRRFVTQRTIEMPGGAANVRVSLAAIQNKPVHHLTPPLVGKKIRWWDTERDALVFRHDMDVMVSTASVNMDHSGTRKLVIADYGKGLFDWHFLLKIAKKFPRAVFSPHLTTCGISPVKLPPELTKDWICVVNTSESAMLKQRWAQAWPVGLMVETNGEFPIRMLADLRPAGYVMPEAVRMPLHVVGIGDCFLAGFAAAHFSGHKASESIRFAAHICTRVLQARRPGTCCVTQEDLG